MKNVQRFVLVSSFFILSFLLFAQRVYADLVFPGQENRSPKFPPPNNQNDLIFYGVVGGIIILVIVVSVFVLVKIRNKNAGK